LFGHPFFGKLSAVKIFLWSRVQAKKRHLGYARAFQIGLIFVLQKTFANWIL